MLPKLPYVMKKNKQQTVAMGGINYSSILRDGDIAHSKGISARAYPYITTRKDRSVIEDDPAITAMTTFQDKPVVVKGSELYYDGSFIGYVLPGEKQFAALSTKLVIMPDKKYLDLETRTLKNLEAEIIGDGAIFGENSLKITDPTYEFASGEGGAFDGNTFSVNIRQDLFVPTEDVKLCVFNNHTSALYDYKVSVAKKIYSGYITGSSVSAVFDISNTAVQTLDLQKLDYICVCFDDEQRQPRCVRVTNIAYASKTIRIFYTDSSIGSGKKKVTIWKRMSDKFGFEEYEEYDRVCLVSSNDYIEAVRWHVEESNSSENYHEFFYAQPENGEQIDYYGLGPLEDAKLTTFGWAEGSFSGLLPGQKILFGRKSGSVPLQNTIPVIVSSVGDSSITVDADFTSELISAASTRTNPDTIVIYRYATESETIDFSNVVKVGDVLSIEGSQSNNVEFRVTKLEGDTIYTEAAFVAEEDSGRVTVRRRIPTLDFICECQNRLWGCSNANRTIYASALGDPTNIYAYGGLSTDSYAVAVGSEGDFTACCRYGDSVLFWKEMKLHKIMGSYPAEYTLYSYDLEGVQSGAHKSLQIMNEVLYYKGIHGVYAFNGSPLLVSQCFGEKRFFGGIGGNDGDTYYLATSDEEGDRYLFAYETKLGLWVLEDDVNVRDFAMRGGDLYMLVQPGKIYLCNSSETSSDMQWFLQLAPFWETMEGRKSYSRILLRVELPESSYLMIDVRADGGLWREAGKIVGKKQDVVPVSIPINRCDKFEIRLRGKGKCTIMSMMREFYLGGDR